MLKIPADYYVFNVLSLADLQQSFCGFVGLSEIGETGLPVGGKKDVNFSILCTELCSLLIWLSTSGSLVQGGFLPPELG